MELFNIEPTNKTPYVNFNPDNGRLCVSGRSIPENSIEFFRPIYNWVEQYISQAQEKTVCEVKLEYFNTSSSKCLIELFRRLETLTQNNKEVLIEWYYDQDDEDMYESGIDFQEVIKIPIHIIPIDPQNE